MISPEEKKARAYERTKAWRKAHPEKVKEYNSKYPLRGRTRKYVVKKRVDSVKELLPKQGGLCICCGKDLGDGSLASYVNSFKAISCRPCKHLLTSFKKHQVRILELISAHRIVP